MKKIGWIKIFMEYLRENDIQIETHQIILYDNITDFKNVKDAVRKYCKEW